MAASISTSTSGSPPKLRVLASPHSREAAAEAFQPPIANTFSFSVSHIWRSNGNMLRWLTDVAGIQREQPLEPQQYHSEKHALEAIDAHSSHDGEHRNKRTKLSSALDHRGPTTERRGRRILQSTRSVARNISDGLQRMITPPRAQNELDGSTIAGSGSGSGSPPGTPTTFVERPRLRFVFVGDPACGKSSLLLRFYRDTFTETWAPTQYELFNKTVHVDGQDVDLELWDTSGKIELNQLSLLSYLAWDGIFLCFSVNNDKKFTNAQTKWINAIHMHCRGAPVFLLGLKKDTRVGSGLWAPLFPHFETRIGATEGNIAAHSIGAVKYMECSAKTGEGVERIFEESTRIVRNIQAGEEVMAREKSMGLGKLLCF